MSSHFTSDSSSCPMRGSIYVETNDISQFQTFNYRGRDARKNRIVFSSGYISNVWKISHGLNGRNGKLVITSFLFTKQDTVIDHPSYLTFYDYFLFLKFNISIRESVRYDSGSDWEYAMSYIARHEKNTLLAWLCPPWKLPKNYQLQIAKNHHATSISRQSPGQTLITAF